MNKQIIIAMGIILIGLVSASYGITAGEPTSLTIPEEFTHYSIVGNSTIVDLNITQNGTIVTILTSRYSEIDTFEIIFFNREKEIIKEIHHGGGGSSTKYIKENVTVYKPIYINDTKITEVEGSTCDVEDIVEEAYPWFKLIIWLLTALAVIIFIIIDVIKYKEGNT